MTAIGVAVGTPLGMLAGTYLAEYGKYSKLAFVVRFINDILLSAPSIVIGSFHSTRSLWRQWVTSQPSPARSPWRCLVVPVAVRDNRRHAEPGSQYVA